MKYKKLTKEQIIISLDRLTRFKYTKDKYLRVFSEILSTCLLEPKLKKSYIEDMDFSELTEIAVTILNDSILAITGNNISNNTGAINKLICEYENTIYINNSETQKLLNNNILYIHVPELIDDNAPVNLKWLKHICTNPSEDLIKLREKEALKYPISKVILAEGITEEILLPAFSKYLGYDFYNKGVQIIAAGGKNQVVKMYYNLINEIKLPIFILLDKDAEENIAQITPKLRNIDKIHLVSCGEFEDLLPKELIVKTVNRHFENFMTISISDFSTGESTAHTLEEIFKTKGLHEFKKAEFAKLVKENISSNSDISNEIREIINELKN